MTNKPDDGFHLLTVIRRLGRIGATMLAGAFLTVLAGFILFMQQQQDLRVWHTADLDEEYTIEKQVTGFAGYLALEDRLFSQLKAEIYDKIPSEERHLLNRYSRGSLSDPAQWPNNWNRSFEFTVPKPVVGVLLLHGLSDSPYSLRRLGQKLSASGAHVLGLRIPGHGTAPSGLVKIKWEDMAGAVRLAMGHLKKQLGDIPLYMVGYSNGGALAVQYILSTLENATLPRASGVVLMSPEIGIAKIAALAVWQGRIGRLLGLPKLAWNSVLPEYDPFKYNSFAVNAGNQAYRLTNEIQNQITRYTKSGVLSRLPPIMAFQSVGIGAVRHQPVVGQRPACGYRSPRCDCCTA